MWTETYDLHKVKVYIGCCKCRRLGKSIIISVQMCGEGPGRLSLSLFDWAICIAPVVCHYFTLISGSIKMHAPLSKKTGGVATCHEIHKQAYVKLGMLHILNSNPPSHFIVGLIC